MAAYGAGDTSAFRELFGHYGERLLHAALRILDEVAVRAMELEKALLDDVPSGRFVVLLGFFPLRRALRGPEHAERSLLLPGLAFLAVAFLEPVLPRAPSTITLVADQFVGRTVGCFIYGIVTGAPVALLVAGATILFARRARS